MRMNSSLFQRMDSELSTLELLTSEQLSTLMDRTRGIDRGGGKKDIGRVGIAILIFRIPFQVFLIHTVLDTFGLDPVLRGCQVLEAFAILNFQTQDLLKLPYEVRNGRLAYFTLPAHCRCSHRPSISLQHFRANVPRPATTKTRTASKRAQRQRKIPRAI